jgi:triphosphoribosyl-dephospho-CoA synthetase
MENDNTRKRFTALIPDHSFDDPIEANDEGDAEIKFIQLLRKIMSEKSDAELIEYFGLLAFEQIGETFQERIRRLENEAGKS